LSAEFLVRRLQLITPAGWCREIDEIFLEGDETYGRSRVDAYLVLARLMLQKRPLAATALFRAAIVVLLFEVIAVVALGARDATPAPKKTHSVTIVSNEPLQAAAPSKREWWEQGIWPLAGAAAVVIISNGVTVAVVFLQASKSFGSLLVQRRIDMLSSSLNDFYNPLLALIDVNEEIYNKTGPPAFPEDEISRNAAGLVWREMKKKILANNEQIESILKTKTHLMSSTDSLESYDALMLHVAVYEAQQRIPTDLYGAFNFPKGVRQHIIDKRAEVRSTFDKLCGVKP
jgi:transcription termination factor NusB